MDPFLKQVARFLYQNYSENMNQLTMVFPSRRSGVFFNAYLNELIDQPLLGPEVRTISEFITRLSDMQISDQIDLIFRLHQIFCEETGYEETLDEFYFWGEILLNDFNDLDKYLLVATDVFQNMTDLKDMENHFDYLSEEQKEFLGKFWRSIRKTAHSVNKEKFLKVWQKLPVIYQRFRDQLILEKTGYSGLVYRTLVEKLPVGSPGAEMQLVFVGFNALNACEQSLFRHFRDQGSALFFWDYDPAFIEATDHEAGLFIRQNRKHFPMPEGYIPDPENPVCEKIRIVSVPGQIAQTQILNQAGFAPQLKVNAHFDDTALILADENLLIPVVSAAGYSHQRINITMGYPLKNTAVYSLLLALTDLQKNAHRIAGYDCFYYKPVLAILNHQLIASGQTRKMIAAIHAENKIYVPVKDLKETRLLETIFEKQYDWMTTAAYLKRIIQQLANLFSEDDDTVLLEAEYLYQVFLALHRLEDSLAKFHLEKVSMDLFFRILRQYMTRISIPFEGEPLSGLQIMGVLETRNLDFEKIVMFSMNEGKLPRMAGGHSFIPYHLRKAFGLPAYEESDAMYAYYFYRLLHRAKEVVLVYDSSGDGINVGEMSRYLFQMRYDSTLKTDWYHLDFNFKSSGRTMITIEGGPQHQKKLLDRYSNRRLSPSALNTYLDCKLKFYFRHIATIQESDVLLEEIDPRLFGNLFHYAAELIYREFSMKPVTEELLDRTRTNKNYLAKVIRKAFAREYFKGQDWTGFELTGKNRLIAENLQTYLEQMLLNDKQFCPFVLLDLEGNYEARFEIRVNKKPHSVLLGGIVDRLDRVKSGTRIVDYKTGRNLELSYRSMEDLFDRSKHKRPKEIFQTFIYAEIFSRKQEEILLPSIYKIDEFFQPDFHPGITHQGQAVVYQQVRESFNKGLTQLLTEMFNASNVYDQTLDENKCRSCPYKLICRRG